MLRGEIWLVNLDPSIGDEIRKTRPAIIVSSDGVGVLALRVIAPITAWQARFKGADWLVRIGPDALNRLDKVSAVDTFQLRAISTQRFVRQLGTVTEQDMQRIVVGMQTVLEIHD